LTKKQYYNIIFHINKIGMIVFMTEVNFSKNYI